MEGWIKISREIASHWLWQDAERLKWWLDLLFLAAWEDKQVLHDSHLFVLRRGQMIASISFLSERWGRSNHTIVKFLKMLESEGMISRRVLHRQTSILTICNYEKYQCNDDSSLHTIVDTIVDRQNDEKPRCEVHKQNSDVSALESDSLRHEDETKVHSQVHSILHTMLHTNKEYNNIFYNNNAHAHDDERTHIHARKDVKELKRSPIWLEQMSIRFKIDKKEIERRLDEFEADLNCRGTVHHCINDAKRHFNDWLRIVISAEKRKNNDGNENKRRGFGVSATTAEDYEGSF